MLTAHIIIECKLLKHIVTSTVEAETAGLSYNCQTAVDIQNMLHALSYYQQSMSVEINNSTVASLVSDMIKTKQSKIREVQYHWLFGKQQDGTF